MAIETLEIWSKQSDNGDSAVRAFSVINASSATQARQAGGIPTPGQAHPENPNLYAGKPACTRPGFNYYVVTVGYSRDKATEETGGNPLSEPARYRWTVRNESIEIDTDINGNPILNSAFDPFGQPATGEQEYIHLTVTKNVPTFDVKQAIEFVNSTNDAPVIIPGAGEVNTNNLYCTSIAPTGDYSLEVDYVNVAYDFDVADADLGIVRILDQGFNAVQKAGEAPKKVPDLTEPVLLDGLGHVFPNKIEGVQDGGDIQGGTTPPGATVEAVPSGQGSVQQGDRAVFLRYRKAPQRTFTELGIFG